MADVTLLRTSAIVQNASVGTTKPPQVSTGSLPLVNVKMMSAGPQVQEGQQRPVQILPSKDPDSLHQTGSLPLVQVKMTQNGPQIDDGKDHPVVIRDNKASVATGGLPMLQVKMENGKPQVQNLPNTKGAPPQIQSAAPVLSQPRVKRVAAPQPAPVAPASNLSIDQLLLCRHLLDKYLGDQRSNTEGAGSTFADNTKLAEDAIVSIDRMIAATNAGALPALLVEESSVEGVEAPVEASVVEAPVVRVAGAYATPVTPAVYPARNNFPARGGYVAPGPGGKRRAAYGRSQSNAAMAPRGVARAGAGLPPVIVKMDGQRPAVQNQAEIAAAKEALAQAQAAAMVQAQAPVEPEAASGMTEG